jgi:predicted nucleic acid-binding protein
VKYLADVSVLVALLWPSHVDHKKVTGWQAGKKLVLCPIAELGFIRVSTCPAFNASMADARQTLADFRADEKPEFIPCDQAALSGDPAPSSAKTTDWYLANLAASHGLKWATLDTGAKHPSAVLIA